MTSLEFTQQLLKQVVPKMAYSEVNNHQKWQEEAYDKLEQLLGLPLPECEDCFEVVEDVQEQDYRCITFQFQSELGYYQKCTMLVPSEIDQPVPGVICMQGHSTGAHISIGKEKFEGDAKTISGGRDFALQAVKQGYCAISVEQRYMGENGQVETGDPACIKKNAALPSILIGRTAIGERVWDIHRLIDIIENHLTEFIDATRIICMGNSGGGTTTFYAACYDSRIYMAIPSCAVCTYDDSIGAMFHCSCNYVPNIRTYFNMGDLGCLIAPRPIFVVSGERDPIFPLEGAKASVKVMMKAYENLDAKDNCYHIIGDGGHQFFPEDVWPMVKKYIEEKGMKDEI